MKTLTATLFLLAPFCGLGQTPVTPAPVSPAKSGVDTTSPSDQLKVSVTSRGNDIRLILTNIFSQAKQSLILQPNIQYALYLSLNDTEFKKAVEVICEQAGLKYDIRDGIYHIYKKKVSAVTSVATPAAFNQSPQIHSLPDATPVALPTGSKTGRLSLSVLKRKVTTKLAKAPIGVVLEELGAQAGVKIELGDNVPTYRLDAILTHTTLRFALEQVTRAAKLTYTLTDHQTILVDARA